MPRLIPPPVQAGSGSSGWLKPLSKPHCGLHPVRAGTFIIPLIGAGKGLKSCYVHRTMKTKTTFLILLGGNLEKTARLRAQIAGARVIAADSGMVHAQGLSLTPELWVGDFDSAADELQERWSRTPRKPFPAAKNLTDGEIAVEEALALGAEKIILAGALGGERSDHAFFHMTLACALSARGIDMLLTSGLEEGWPLRAVTQTIDLPPSSMFSILNFDGVSGLTIEGARYPLTQFELAFGSSRTISNIAEGPIKVTVGSGTALLAARPFDLSGN